MLPVLPNLCASKQAPGSLSAHSSLARLHAKVSSTEAPSCLGFRV